MNSSSAIEARYPTQRKVTRPSLRGRAPTFNCRSDKFWCPVSLQEYQSEEEQAGNDYRSMLTALKSNARGMWRSAKAQSEKVLWESEPLCEKKAAWPCHLSISSYYFWLLVKGDGLHLRSCGGIFHTHTMTPRGRRCGRVAHWFYYKPSEFCIPVLGRQIYTIYVLCYCDKMPDSII